MKTLINSNEDFNYLMKVAANISSVTFQSKLVTYLFFFENCDATSCSKQGATGSRRELRDVNQWPQVQDLFTVIKYPWKIDTSMK